MAMMEIMHTYFRGEKAAGAAIGVFGLVLLGVALYFYRSEQGAFMWGLVIPLALLGLGAAGGGGGLILRTNGQIAEFERLLREDPAAYVAQERPRMEKVNANWPRLKAAWVVIILASLLTLFLVKKDWATGLSLVFLFAAATVMAVDVFAERRAEIYTAGVEALSAELDGGGLEGGGP